MMRGYQPHIRANAVEWVGEVLFVDVQEKSGSRERE